MNSYEFRALVERIERLSADSNALAHKAAFWHQVEDDIRGDILSAWSLADGGQSLSGIPYEVWSKEGEEWAAAAKRLDAMAGKTVFADAIH